jgi:hypothetical protein
MKSSLKNDIIKGKEAEKFVLPHIQKYFKRDIKKTEGRYCKYDFEDSEFKYELKSRNNTKDKFDTTLIGADKIVSNKIIFLFYFTDGLYYIEYNEELFNTFGKSMFCREQRGGYNDKPKEYIFIPVNLLIKIEIGEGQIKDFETDFIPNNQFEKLNISINS